MGFYPDGRSGWTYPQGAQRHDVAPAGLSRRGFAMFAGGRSRYGGREGRHWRESRLPCEWDSSQFP